jgi:hypothetical protein
VFCLGGAHEDRHLPLFVPLPRRHHDAHQLPELHRIFSATLSPSYGCRSHEDFNKGYESTALFLTPGSKDWNSPDLLFNGACKSKDYFLSSTAGDDMSLIADLGTIPLEQVTAEAAFNIKMAAGNDSHFLKDVEVQTGHTYAVVINKSQVRGLFVFKVDDYVPNKQVTLRYAVKVYQLLQRKQQSPGFSWDMPNRK